MTLTRRTFTLGGLVLPGCTAINSLNDAAQPRDTYELQPAFVSAQGARSARSLLVLVPTAPAAITSDRILIRQDPLSVTYLPDARWSAEVPQMLQSVLIQTLAGTGRLGYVGAQGAGPVPDTVLLTRIDAFDVTAQSDGSFEARISCELTVLRDRDQRVLGTRRFTQALPVATDRTTAIVGAFQQLLDALLPEATTWVLARTR